MHSVGMAFCEHAEGDAWWQIALAIYMLAVVNGESKAAHAEAIPCYGRHDVLMCVRPQAPNTIELAQANSCAGAAMFHVGSFKRALESFQKVLLSVLPPCPYCPCGLDLGESVCCRDSQRRPGFVCVSHCIRRCSGGRRLSCERTSPSRT